MKRAWVLVIVCGLSACKKRDNDAVAVVQTQPSPAEAPKHPHADFPTAAAAGTEKLFFLEEPDRGPRAPASYTPPSAEVVWTTAAYLEVDETGIAHVDGGTPRTVHWRYTHAPGLIVEKMRGDRIDETYVFVPGPDGLTKQRLHLTGDGALDLALLFGQKDRATGRTSSGANALHGCGMLSFVGDTEVHCLQWLGEPMRDMAGVAVRKRTRDKHGFIADERRFGIDGAPVMDRLGVHRIANTRDEAGRLVMEQYFDTQDQRTVSTIGCAGQRVTWGDNGAIARQTCLDLGDAPVADANGVTAYDTAYDAGACATRMRFHDATGAAVADRSGVAGYDYDVDAHCRTTAETCVDVKGAPTACGPGRPARRVYARDARGNISSEKSYRADGTPGGDVEYGVFEVRNTYDAHDNQTDAVCFDKDGMPVDCGTTGFHGWHAVYDDVGRMQVQTYIDVSGSRTTNLGIVERHLRYDNYDHEVEARNTDGDGTPVSANGEAIRRNLWDASHRLFGVLLFDAADHPARYTGCYAGATCPGEPWHAMRIKRRPNGAVATNEFFDEAGQLIDTVDCTQKPCFDTD